MSFGCLATLTVAGVPVPFSVACDSLSQRYDVIGSGLTRRLATTISGAGVLPPALAGVDWSAPVEIGCVASRAVIAAGTIALLPTARRPDAPVFALAHLASGALVRAGISTVVDDQVHLVAVAGAVAYQVHYYPLMTVTSAGPNESWDVFGAASSWELRCEERPPAALQPPSLIIGGVEIVPELCANSLSQRYERLSGGRTVLRMANGAALPQTRWTKLRTTISASGPLPPPFSGIDWSGPLELSCIAPRATHNGSAPTAARSDTPVLSVPEVGGVDIDQTHYYPKLTIVSDGPRETWDAINSVSGWELDCEEA